MTTLAIPDAAPDLRPLRLVAFFILLAIGIGIGLTRHRPRPAPEALDGGAATGGTSSEAGAP
jgi:hypothetical protein